jgi:RNA polymerase sigma factor (sigma-70 family)
MKSEKQNSNEIERLISACLKKDRIAQIKLYELFVRSMYNTSLRILQDTMLAEDVVQESFIKAFSSLSTFRNEVPFASWLKRIVINRSLDELRRRKHLILIEEEKLVDIEIIDKYEFDKTDNTEILIKIRKVMNELSEGYRLIFSLYYFEGYDHAEISQILNITTSTSRSQLVRAKNKVVEKLKLKTNYNAGS